MLRPFYKISVQQVTPYTYKDTEGNSITVQRNELFDIDFPTEYEIDSGWENHTNNAHILIAKNIVLQKGDALFKQSGSYNVILGLGDGGNVNSDLTINTLPPLIMRGDIIYISDGYFFMNEVYKEVQVGKTHFAGFVSKIHSSIPIKIELEDNFFLLKRTPVNKSTFSGNLIDLCKYMVDRVNSLFYDKNPIYPKLSVNTITDSITANFSLGFLDIGDITCAQLLSRIKTEYKLYSGFTDNELRFGFPIYDESKADSKSFFEFQNNIFNDHNLEYKSKQDVVLSTVVSSKTITQSTRKTIFGAATTKKIKKSVLVYWDIPTETFKYITKIKGEPFPENSGGERHECIYPISPYDSEPSEQELFNFGVEQLKKYFYTGFRGNFTTFGYPFVEWNDNVNILDKVISDRNGQYKVKRVIRRGGYRGITQQIFLDYKQNVSIPDFTTIYMI